MMARNNVRLNRRIECDQLRVSILSVRDTTKHQLEHSHVTFPKCSNYVGSLTVPRCENVWTEPFFSRDAVYKLNFLPKCPSVTHNFHISQDI